jgi:hypothetical protein
MGAKGKLEDVMLVVGLAAGGYALYKLFSVASSAAGAVGSAVSAVGAAASNAYQSTVSAVGSGLFSLFGPSDVGTNMYYTVAFPDQSHHAVPSNTVDADGNFVWTGYPPGSTPAITLTLVKDSMGNWWATSNAIS